MVIAQEVRLFEELSRSLPAETVQATSGPDTFFDAGSGQQPSAVEASSRQLSPAAFWLQPAPNEEAFERKFSSLLDNASANMVKTIASVFAQVAFEAQKLDSAMRIIFERALAEPPLCEAPVDVVSALLSMYAWCPAYASTLTSRRKFLGAAYIEIDTLPVPLGGMVAEGMAAEGTVAEDSLQEKRLLAYMDLLGNLFLNELLTEHLIGQVFHELIGIKEFLPDEHKIRCICELLTTIGHNLEEGLFGSRLMSQFADRLLFLQGHMMADGQAAYSATIQLQIQRLLYFWQNKWLKYSSEESSA